MGKQSRRKKRRNDAAGRRHRPAGFAADVPPPASEGDASPSSTIVAKIRHGDPRVRHAALVALSGTLYDGDSLSRSAAAEVGARNMSGESSPGGLSASDPSLLRALSERVLDVDPPCAIAAAGCLSNYVSFYCGGMVDGADVEDRSKRDEVEVASEVMAPILLQRLQTSLGALRSLCSKIMAAEGGSSGAADKNSNENTKKGKAKVPPIEKLWSLFEEQWSLLSFSLLTLAGVIENCPKAVRRTGANAFPQLLAVLALAYDSLQLMVKDPGSEDGGSAASEKRGQSRVDAAAYASRALHSLLDDNTPLISSLPLVNAAASSSTDTSLVSAVAQLTQVISNEELSDETRLHASGSILSFRRTLVLEGDKSLNHDPNRVEGGQLVSELQFFTNEVIVPMLHSMLENDISDPKRLVSQMLLISKKLSTAKKDEVMESQIVNEVNARKEPVRLIARRQKKMKEEKQQRQQQQNQQQHDDCKMTMEKDYRGDQNKDHEREEGNTAMVVEEEAKSKDFSSDCGGNDDVEQDAEKLEKKLNGVVQAWRDLVGSQKLALELVANIFSGGEITEEQVDSMVMHDEDEDEPMWNSDDEARLAEEAAMPLKSNKCTSSEQTTYNAVAGQHLPEQILAFFTRWAQFSSAASSEDGQLPALVSRDVDELLSTCALCLGNMVACNALTTWSTNDDLCLFWRDLASVLSLADDRPHVHATSVMLLLLRSQPRVCSLVDSDELDRLVSILSSQQPASNRSGGDDASYFLAADALVTAHCNVVSILGALCSEPHTASVDERVCSALLVRLRSAISADDCSEVAMKRSVTVTNEILNVLMDVYGADDCHEEVFVEQEVLGHFHRCLPSFKRRIKRVALLADEGETETWRETALNTSRFIKYKQR